MLQTLKMLLFLEGLQLMALAICMVCMRDIFRRVVGPTEVLLLMLTPVVGLFGHNKTVFYVYAALIPLTAVGRIDRLAIRYVLMIGTFPVLLEPYIVGGQYFGELGTIDFFNAGALIAMLTVGSKKLKTVAPLAVAAVLVYFVALMLSVRGVPLNGVLRRSAFSFLSVLLPFFVVAQSVRSREAASDVLAALIVGAAGNAVVALFEVVRHWPLYQSIYSNLHVELEGLSATLAVRSGMIRAQGMVSNYETLGLLTGFGLLTAIAIRPRLSFLGFWTLVILLGGPCLASQSRGAWIGVVVGLAVYALYERRTTILFGLGGLAIAVVGVSAFAPAGSKVGQIIGRSGHGQQTIEYRSNLLSRGLHEVAAHPLLGQTRDQLEVSMNDMRQGQHIIDFVNTHLNVALVGGLPLLVVWLSAWLAPMIMAWRVSRRSGAHGPIAPVALPLGMIVTSVIFLCFTSMTDRIPALVTIAFGLMSAFLRLSAKPIAASIRKSSASQPASLVLSTPI